jgi:hypothetical protein
LLGTVSDKPFKYVELEIPKHLEILVNSIENQKSDLEILPI